MNRLILLTGPGGAGTSALAEATVQALHDEGLSATLVDGAGRAAVVPEAVEAITGSVGKVMSALGAEGLPVEAWLGLPGLGHLSTLLRATALEAEVDAVVIDAGPIEHARALVQLPGILERLLDAALSPGLAMWRTADGDDVAFDALSDARRTLVRLGRLLRSPDATLRLVVPPSAVGEAAAGRALALFSTLGVGVDGVIVNRFPRKSDPGSDRAQAQASLERIIDAADGVAVWRSTSRLRPVPKGRSVLGPLGPVRVLDEAALAVAAEDERFVLDLSLAPAARAAARVGVTGERLVVEFDGAYRWLDLPPVLRRCHPVGGTRLGDRLRLEFQPNAGLWMGGSVVA